MLAPRARSVLFAAAALAFAATLAREARAESPVLTLERSSKPDIPRARELDAAGVRAYRDGRFREALFLFTESYRLGGPSLELWNVARCHQRLDEGDEAAAVLLKYLDQTDLYPRDRAEATRELADLSRRPSALVVDVSATGAPVFVDGRKVGVAPLVTELPPGKHLVRVELDSEAREWELEARNGRPQVVRASEMPKHEASENETALRIARRVELAAQGGIYAHELGKIFGRVGPSVTLGARFGIGRAPVSGFLGARGEFYSTSWPGEASDQTFAQCKLPDRFRAGGIAGLAGGGIAWDASPSVRTTLELGAGIETFFPERGGGVVLEQSCSPQPGVVPAFAARAEVSYRIAPAARMLLTPIAIAAHPAYDGARRTPEDATGTWLRLGASLGLSYDVGL